MWPLHKTNMGQTVRWRGAQIDSLPDFIRDPSISTDSFRRICLRDTSACGALEVDNFMRYINLLTYLLIGK